VGKSPCQVATDLAAVCNNGCKSTFCFRVRKTMAEGAWKFI
jgi:hypothetical protein